MNAPTIFNANNPTMSSREIAELTGKHHQHVKRDIESMLEALEKDVTSFGRIYFDTMNRQQTEYHLPKDLTLTLVTGYDVKRRHAINVRWLELESKQQVDPMTLLNDPASMRTMLLSYTEKVIKLESTVAMQAPKVEAFNRIADADGMMNLQAAGKALQQQPNKFVAWLREKGWIYKRPGGSTNLPRADKFNAGYLTVKTMTIQNPDGTERVKEQTMMTPKGLAKLALLLNIDSQPTLI